MQGSVSRLYAHLAGAVMLAGATLCAHAQAPATPQRPEPGTASRPVTGPAVSIYDLMQAGPIPENVLGSPTAPVTIIEYASLTCPHCAAFHANTVPKLKKDYIDTGKVKFVFRDFPFDGVAMAGTMISRCADPAKFFPMTEVLFQRQEKWAFGSDPEKELTAIALEFGFTQESFDKCLQNQSLYDGVIAVRKRAYDVFRVDSTPTLFVNGVPYRGGLSPEQLEAAIKPHLTDAK